jgi:hypothetical protein
MNHGKKKVYLPSSCCTIYRTVEIVCTVRVKTLIRVQVEVAVVFGGRHSSGCRSMSTNNKKSFTVEFSENSSKRLLS